MLDSDLYLESMKSYKINKIYLNAVMSCPAQNFKSLASYSIHKQCSICQGGLGGLTPSLVPLNLPKFVLTLEKIVKISQKYIADPSPLFFSQIEYCTPKPMQSAI